MKLRTVIPKIKFLSTEENISDDLSNSVVAFQIQKNMSQLAGSFQMVLTPRASDKGKLTSAKTLSYIYRNIMPMDLISIGIESEGGMMLTLVDNVFKNRTIMNNQVNQTIVVRGRDLGKILIEDNTMFAPSADDGYIHKLIKKLTESGIVGSDEDVTEHPLVNMFTSNRAPKNLDPDGGDIGRTFIGKTVSEAIEYVLKSLSSLRVKVTFDGKKDVSVHELLKIQTSTRDGDQIATESHNRYIGSLANLLYAIIDKDFYEIFIETIGGYGVLIVRPKPYDRVDDKISKYGGGFKTISKNDKHLWTDLRTLVDGKNYHEITEDDIVQLNMGVSDYEANSIYIQHNRMTLLGVPIETSGMFFPMLDVFSLKRYGLKLKETVSNLFPMEITEKKVKDQDKIEDRIRGFRDRIFNWYRYNPILESGQVTVRGHDYYKLGDPVKLVDEIAQNGELGIKAYCVGYSHSWQFGQPFLTTLHLIRGENEKRLDEYRMKTDPDLVRSAG